MERWNREELYAESLDLITIERDREDVKYLARQGLLNPEELRRRYEKEMRPYIARPEDRLDRNLELWLEMIREDAQANTTS